MWISLSDSGLSPGKFLGVFRIGHEAISGIGALDPQIRHLLRERSELLRQAIPPSTRAHTTSPELSPPKAPTADAAPTAWPPCPGGKHTGAQGTPSKASNR